jgi:hypothetical protein
MTEVQIIVNVSAEELIRIAREQLGLVPKQEAVKQTAPTMVRSDFTGSSDAVVSAIAHVIRATEKYDQDQYTNGVASAATALFEAGKRLRKVIAEEQTTRTTKGRSHV